MRGIIFICGSLEPGRDGVGDYSRRLAGELIRQGQAVSIIALNDRHIQNSFQDQQESEGITVPVLRLASNSIWKVRKYQAKNWIEDRNPEWLSLQYVPFSFQRKGLPWRLAGQLREIGKGRKWQMMFHELWVGMDKESSFKFRLWGTLQKYLTRRVVSRIHPVLFHTQASLHKDQLENISVESELLPLFGNIPCNSFSKIKIENSALKFVIFGMIHPGAPISQFADDMLVYSKKEKKQITFIFIGRNGALLNEWVRTFEQYHFQVHVMGEQEPERISEVLGKADYGINSTPVYLIEKSGTVAAMREHQLPILCISRSWHARNSIKPQLPAGIKEYLPGNFEFLKKENTPIVFPTLEEVTKTFSKSLGLDYSFQPSLSKEKML
jgi:hypothetical protein